MFHFISVIFAGHSMTSGLPGTKAEIKMMISNLKCTIASCYCAAIIIISWYTPEIHDKQAFRPFLICHTRAAPNIEKNTHILSGSFCCCFFAPSICSSNHSILFYRDKHTHFSLQRLDSFVFLYFYHFIHTHRRAVHTLKTFTVYPSFSLHIFLFLHTLTHISPVVNIWFLSAAFRRTIIQSW